MLTQLRIQVFELVGLTELYYAGSHGMDIMGPVNEAVSSNHPDCIISTDQQVRDENSICHATPITFNSPVVMLL